MKGHTHRAGFGRGKRQCSPPMGVEGSLKGRAEKLESPFLCSGTPPPMWFHPTPRYAFSVVICMRKQRSCTGTLLQTPSWEDDPWRGTSALEKAPASKSCPGQLGGISETKGKPALCRDTLGRNAECPGQREELA